MSESFPEGIKSSMQYGAGVKALTATLNRAEQSLRMAKVKGKVSGCMRTDTGAFAAIMSFIGSVKKHGIHVFSAVKKAFLGNAYGVLFPALTE